MDRPDSTATTTTSRHIYLRTKQPARVNIETLPKVCDWSCYLPRSIRYEQRLMDYLEVDFVVFRYTCQIRFTPRYLPTSMKIPHHQVAFHLVVTPKRGTPQEYQGTICQNDILCLAQGGWIAVPETIDTLFTDTPTGATVEWRSVQLGPFCVDNQILTIRERPQPMQEDDWLGWYQVFMYIANMFPQTGVCVCKS